MADLSVPCPFDLLRSRLECMLDAPASPDSSPSGSRRGSLSCPLPALAGPGGAPIGRTASGGTSSSASSTCSDAAPASSADTPAASPVAGASGRGAGASMPIPAQRKRSVRFADEVTHLGPGSLRRASYASGGALAAAPQQQQQPSTPSPTPVVGVEEKADLLRSRLESLWGGRFGGTGAGRSAAARGAAYVVAA